MVADSFYGRSHKFRSWLEKRGRPYAVMVPKSNAVRCQGRRKKIERLALLVPEEAWATIPTREEDSCEKRLSEWACLELSVDPGGKGMQRWLLIRRSLEEPYDESTPSTKPMAPRRRLYMSW